MSWQVGLYVAAVLIPLGAFAIELVGIRLLGRLNAYLATGAIALSFVLSLVGFVDYFFVEARGVFAERHPTKQVVPEPGHVPPPGAGAEAGPAASARRHGPLVWKASYDWVTLGTGSYAPKGQAAPARPVGLTIPLAVHVDNLTVIMFLMVSLIATLI
ncbi:MAG TPA: NADH-quinone oxidoreductase subunit L, partial [Isosphaeraceae bacterium]|nr:NADH-quinone oxidoreductase subunit L [Isosphaeraceae bacterium]